MASPNGVDRRSHIVAINNDQDVLALFRDLLEAKGYRVSTQAYAEKNLDAVVALKPDLIILDYMWKDDDAGWSFLQMLRMRPETAHIPIVLCTGAVLEVEALSGHLCEMGVQVVCKPFRIKQLLDAIATQLALTPPVPERESAEPPPRRPGQRA